MARHPTTMTLADQLRARIDEQPPLLRARFSSPEMKKELLESMVRFELLAGEARKRGLDKDPEVQEGVRKLMVQRLLRSAFDEQPGQAAGEDELRRYYAAPSRRSASRPGCSSPPPASTS